jgi:acyl dehydratase
VSSVEHAPELVGGPWFEQFERGQVFDDAPGLTLTAGHAAMHQALTGDRLRLALDAVLCREVTGGGGLLAHPNLVCDIAIGQSTGPSQRVRGNLFYRGLVLARPVFVGETLRSRTEVVGLKQNRRRPGAPATGLVALRIRTTDERGEPLLDFWRCPMIPLRDADADTGHADDFAEIPQLLDAANVRAALPAGWRLDRLRAAVPRPHRDELAPGQAFVVEAGETVTGAPELARLTLNLATAHTDATGSAHGRRLVYGGHTISVAAAHATRAIPAIATIVAWHGCKHLGPVFEGDVLRTELRVQDVGSEGLVDLRALVSAARSDEAPAPVLDWSFRGGGRVMEAR